VKCDSHHDYAIARQQWVNQSFAEEHAVRHVKNARFVSVAKVFETNCIADLEIVRRMDILFKKVVYLVSKLRSHFRRNAIRDRGRGDATRLSAGDDVAIIGPPSFIQILRKFCNLQTRQPNDCSLDVRVVFPQPVCPTTMTTPWFSTANRRPCPEDASDATHTSQIY